MLPGEINKQEDLLLPSEELQGFFDPLVTGGRYTSPSRILVYLSGFSPL
jgi:hypothetical protein